jgi:hypothetical protein
MAVSAGTMDWGVWKFWELRGEVRCVAPKFAEVLEEGCGL